MADALIHRGPDEDGYLSQPGLALASRRLSIVGLSDGRQPVGNEDGSVVVVYNGELFDYPEQRAELAKRGHRFHTHTDTELIPHLWEDHGEELFERLRGQFAFALWDERQQRLVLARDRLGICPLFWTRQTRDGGDWLLFASEIKALLRSGLVEPRADVRGIDQLFTLFGLPGPITCFEGIRLLRPGHFLSVQREQGSGRARVEERCYWEMDFPDRGEEERGENAAALVDELEERLLRAVGKRLRADVPVVSYLSGGLDSGLVLAMAGRLCPEPPPAFTIQIPELGFDETVQATATASHVGARPVVVRCDAQRILHAYGALIEAAECPVNNTACGALLLLAREVHAQGYKVALKGEGADELLAGYPWHKAHKLLSWLGTSLGQLARRSFFGLAGAPGFSWESVCRGRAAAGGPNAWLDMHTVVGLFKRTFYSRDLRERLGDRHPYEDLGLNGERLRRWHPFNRSLYIGLRTHLPGLLLSHASDRIAMHSSVETRYPFLDEDVVAYLAKLHPRWKLRGFREKYLLRLVAERWLPKEAAWRTKKMFQAPFDVLCSEPVPPFVEQLLSEEALERTGYFDATAVRHWRGVLPGLRPQSARRLALELALGGVAATQLWHQMFLGGGLADLPSSFRGTGLPCQEGGPVCGPSSAEGANHLPSAVRR